MSPMISIKEVAFVLANSRDDCRYCEQILERYLSQSETASFGDRRSDSLLHYYLDSVPNAQFRKLFHINKSTIQVLVTEIRSITNLHFCSCNGRGEEETLEGVAISVLFLNSQFSMNFLSLFCGQPKHVVQSNILQFNTVLDQIKEHVIYFPSLDNQKLLKPDKNNCFPGSVGVLGTSGCER